jgi:hypothetical protein
VLGLAVLQPLGNKPAHKGWYLPPPALCCAVSQPARNEPPLQPLDSRRQFRKAFGVLSNLLHAASAPVQRVFIASD